MFYWFIISERYMYTRSVPFEALSDQNECHLIINKGSQIDALSILAIVIFDISKQLDITV